MGSDYSLRQLADRAAIEDVVIHYAYGIDTNDDDLLASCFTADATAEYAGVKVQGGGQGILEFIQRSRGSQPRAPGPKARHFVTNVHIMLDGDRATAQSYALACRLDAEGQHAVSFLGVRYQDRLVRGHDGQWRIAERVHSADWEAKMDGVSVMPTR